VLESLVRQQALPDIKALPAQTQQLEAALKALESAPTTASLGEARTAFQKTLLAFMRAQTFRSGPLVESNTFLRAAFWPVRAANLEQLIVGTEALDAARIEALGVDAKGLFALERLLWDAPRGAQQSWIEGPSAPRVRSFACALASDVATRVSAAVASMGDGTAFATSFAAGGQASLTKLLTQNVENIESIAVDRLQRAMALSEQKRLRLGELQADFCGLSSQISLVQLEALRALYVGHDGQGIAALVAQAAPQVAPRVGLALDQALAALRGVTMPLEQAVVRQPEAPRAALVRVKALEVAYKADLATALALTLSIVSGDGD
jgi:predicted lipoprotein